MASVRIFTDPHLGLTKTVGTTSKSRQLYQDKMYKVAFDCLSSDKPNLCAGDLFDRAYNCEEILNQGFDIVKNCDIVLGGNHDVPNKEGRLCSLGFLHQIDPQVVAISPDPSSPTYFAYTHENTEFVLVPHCLTQEIFVKSLENAAASVKEAKNRVLILHCNVGDGFGPPISLEGASLWLTSELQDLCVAKFDLVLIGHEHEAKTFKQGKIVVMGNTYPVNFGEISPRYYYDLDIDTLTLTRTQIFFPETQYAHFTVQEFLELDGGIVTAELVEVTGTLKRSDQASYSRAIVKTWKNNPELLSLKSSVELEKETAVTRKFSGNSRTLSMLVKEAVEEAGYGNEFGEISYE